MDYSHVSTLHTEHTHSQHSPLLGFENISGLLLATDDYKATTQSQKLPDGISFS